jgi:hypothetical protein
MSPTSSRIGIGTFLENAEAREISVVIQKLTLRAYAAKPRLCFHRVGAVKWFLVGAFSHIPARFILAFLGDLLQLAAVHSDHV